MPTFHLELCGEICPVPLLRTQKQMERLSSGDCLIIETEQTQAVRNIARWATKEGHQVEVEEVDNGLWQITLWKK